MSEKNNLAISTPSEAFGQPQEAARRLNISRQAEIKTLVRAGLDQRYMAASARHRVGARDAGS